MLKHTAAAQANTWVEKDDILRWIKKAIGYTGDETQIVVMGQSMGGATA